MDPDSKISLNVHLQVPSTTNQDGSHTPNTPEIVNSIVNMTAGPFAPDFFRSSNHHHHQVPSSLITSSTSSPTTSNSNSVSATATTTSIVTAASPEAPSVHSPSVEENPVYTASEPGLTYADITAMDTTTSSNLSTSPATTPGSSMSVQAYTSQFIKEGLRIKMRQKMGSGGNESGGSTQGSASTVSAAEGSKSASLPGSKLAVKRINIATLAPEDAVRRLRRRERNKVAATKCRNKKKARTSCLMKESEIMDAQNKALKLEISKLESEKHHLMDILQEHEPNCAKKLKEVMKVRHQSGGFEFIPPQSTSSQSGLRNPDPEFRVPLPPASMVVSSNPQQRVPMIKVTASTPEEPDPPTFAEAIQMVTEVKAEEEEEISGYSLDGYFGHNSQNPVPDDLDPGSRIRILQDPEDFFSHHHHTPHHQQLQNPFLAKRTLGQTYLDLDSRCIAL